MKFKDLTFPNAENGHIWYAPTLRELQETENTFEKNKSTVVNFFRALLMRRLKDGFVDFRFAKTLFQSPWLSHAEDFASYEDFEDCVSTAQKLAEDRMSDDERERERQAQQYARSISGTRNNLTDSAGYYGAPKIYHSRMGTLFTNVYCNVQNGEPVVSSPESRDYRINLGLVGNISNTRVLIDLYQLLCANPVLAQYGFDIKSLGNNRTDAIIVYCGAQGLQAALSEVGEYCITENIGNATGVPFGVKPVTHDGRVLGGVSVTSTPGDFMTFNDLQSIALGEAFVDFVNVFLKKRYGVGVTDDNASDAQLESIFELCVDSNSEMLKFVEQQYVAKVQTLCHDTNVDVRNLAFVKVKK